MADQDMTRKCQPHRVQLRRIPGWRLPDNTVYVARPSRWSNPYRAGGWRGDELAYGRIATAAEAVTLFRAHIAPWLDLTPLRGKNLACYCALEAPCHADVLLELANHTTEDSRPGHATHGMRLYGRASSPGGPSIRGWSG